MKRGDNVPLNGDHTHFIMIDDASRYRFFGKSTEFITRFATMIRDQEPVVRALVNISSPAHQLRHGDLYGRVVERTSVVHYFFMDHTAKA